MERENEKMLLLTCGHELSSRGFWNPAAGFSNVDMILVLFYDGRRPAGASELYFFGVFATLKSYTHMGLPFSLCASLGQF
jgi:hypothetical protein